MEKEKLYKIYELLRSKKKVVQNLKENVYQAFRLFLV